MNDPTHTPVWLIMAERVRERGVPFATFYASLPFDRQDWALPYRAGPTWAAND